MYHWLLRDCALRGILIRRPQARRYYITTVTTHGHSRRPHAYDFTMVRYCLERDLLRLQTQPEDSGQLRAFEAILRDLPGQLT